ncbi:hypothetical protein L1077_07270 [Pseudoalteromonas luteoviolacea]|uniref:hypothetical protein n=1 Tax=Pseudoalteromonas luteoviolacea TaxID=43657 RepID=UPI001F289F15|nr:hypothetical protein [Pseudoalteromonas luteoviolacea]MCF6439224.1 hypothetical protein [Pseudoalteromonas luteoviolacea]
MKTYIGLMLSAWLLAGCADGYGEHQNESTTDMTLQKDVSDAIARAVEDKDFRLYATTGRRPVFPGLEQFDFDELKVSCGLKYLPSTGDVIKSEQDKLQRLKQYEFAKRYNLKIYARCKENAKA